MKKTVTFIVGPTAAGKTAFAVALAKKTGGEVISCDSMQVYKGARVLTQAPSSKDTGRVRYHLINFLSPQKEFSAAIFVKKARRLIKDIIGRGKTPIFAGGTGLYVKALVDGLFPSPEADRRFRERMYRLASRHGSGYLHEKLRKADSEAARLIHKNDTRRIVRALEIYSGTGRTMTELKKETKGIKDEYRIKMLGLTAERETIYSNINKRVEEMVACGATEEVKRLRKKKLSRTARSMIGLRELAGYLDGEYDIETAKELMKRNTRRLAKRQLTWFGADKRIKWLKKR